MKVGDIYISKEDDSKVKITQLYDVELYPDEPYSETKTVVTYIQFINGSLFGEPMGDYKNLFLKSYKAAKRNPHCVKCKRELNEVSMEICPKCHGIICPDDQYCLCHYNKYAISWEGLAVLDLVF